MEVKSNWWLPHLALALAIPGFVLFVIVFGMIETLFGSIEVGSSGDAFGYSIILGYMALFFVALYGYSVESRRLKEAGSEWIPHPWLWAVLHFGLTPFVASALYLVRRRQKVGLPLGDLKRSVATRS